MNMSQAILRRKMLEQLYDKMSQEEKLVFVQMTMQNKSNEQIIARLDDVRQRVIDANGGRAFTKDFLANVLGNYAADASIYLAAKLLKAIR